MQTLTGAKVTYSDGTVIKTSMAAGLTDEEIMEYFKVGRVFNLGSVEDKMARVVKCEVLR